MPLQRVLNHLWKAGELARMNSLLDVIPPLEAQHQILPPCEKFRFRSGAEGVSSAAEKRFGTRGWCSSTFPAALRKVPPADARTAAADAERSAERPAGSGTRAIPEIAPDGKLRWMEVFFPKRPKPRNIRAGPGNNLPAGRFSSR